MKYLISALVLVMGSNVFASGPIRTKIERQFESTSLRVLAVSQCSYSSVGEFEKQGFFNYIDKSKYISYSILTRYSVNNYGFVTELGQEMIPSTLERGEMEAARYVYTAKSTTAEEALRLCDNERQAYVEMVKNRKSN
ncbi:hypothetical protein D3C72_1589450 [compost metagenome]